MDRIEKKIVSHDYDVVIIGGGFFGCSLALYLKRHRKKVLLLEMSEDLMQRASYANQARVHNGYHYPRSITTALRSRINFPKFVQEYEDCITKSFEQYYAVGRNFSKVSATQFKLFMERIGAEIRLAPDRVKNLTNPDYIEDIFRVKEYAFDAVRLKNRLWQELETVGTDIWLNTKAIKVKANSAQNLQITCLNSEGETCSIIAGDVYNITYAHLNQILVASELPLLSLKYEVTEMTLIELPDELRGVGVTVMCGPFFSFMPFPPIAGASTLSHVSYTPHHSWSDNAHQNYIDPYQHLESLPKVSNYPYMIRDACRYIPVLEKSTYIDSIWEIKTVLPQSEVDDSRPILMRKDHGISHLHCIMGGKIDNIYDVFAEL